MYVFDSYLLILYKLIVSPSIHENLHAPSKTARVINWSIMEAKKQFICYWWYIVNINGNIILLPNRTNDISLIFRWKQSWYFTQKHITLCDFLQKKQVKLPLTTFAHSILYLKSSSQWTLLRKDILS